MSQKKCTFAFAFILGDSHMTQMILFDYSQLLRQVKQRVSQAQQRAIYAANEELLRLVRCSLRHKNLRVGGMAL